MYRSHSALACESGPLWREQVGNPPPLGITHKVDRYWLGQSLGWTDAGRHSHSMAAGGVQAGNTFKHKATP